MVKLQEISPDLVADQGFVESLESLLSDGNPMVVSNSVAALQEISSRTSNKALSLTSASVLKLLAVLNEASEWGQVYILDALSGYRPADTSEAESILDRVKPRLQHANSAVVLSTTKVMMKCLESQYKQFHQIHLQCVLTPIRFFSLTLLTPFCGCFPNNTHTVFTGAFLTIHLLLKQLLQERLATLLRCGVG